MRIILFFFFFFGPNQSSPVTDGKSIRMSQIPHDWRGVGLGWRNLLLSLCGELWMMQSTEWICWHRSMRTDTAVVKLWVDIETNYMFFKGAAMQFYFYFLLRILDHHGLGMNLSQYKYWFHFQMLSHQALARESSKVLLTAFVLNYTRTQLRLRRDQFISLW